LDLYLTYHPTGGVQVPQKEWNLLSDDVKAILQITESFERAEHRLIGTQATFLRG
jgi:hypothetical protein